MPTARPLRVVHIAGTANGAPWMVAFLRELAALGHDARAIISRGEGSTAPALARHGIPSIATDLELLDGRSLLRGARAILDLARLLRRLRPDVLHSHLFPTLLIARMAAWIADVPVRISMNCGPYHLQSPILRDLEAGLAWMDTKTVASCELTRRIMIEQGIPPRQVELIYYAVDQSAHDPALADGMRARRDLGLAADDPVIGQIAYFYPPSYDPRVTPAEVVGRGVKGHDVIVRAVPLVLREMPRTKFVFTGSGWGPAGEVHKREIEQLVRDLGVSGAVIFTGERRDVPDLLASFDVALQCSLNENLGGSVEALLMARPTVVTNVGGLTDTVRHEQTGLVVPPDDPQALAAAILRLLRDRPFAAQLGRNGRALMLERFSLARSVADLETLYQREAAQAPRGYRLLTSAMRLARLPFRVLPLVFRVHKALGGGSIVRALVRRAAAVVHRIVHRTLKRAPSRMTATQTSRQTTSPRTTPQPRIAHIAAASSGSQWVVDFASETARRGFDVIAVIDAAPGDLRERLVRAGIRVHTVPMVFGERLDRARLPFYLARLPLSALKLAWILRRERIDIAHSHIFVANLVTRLARILTPVRHVAGITGPRHLEAPLTRGVDRKTWWLDDVTAAGCRHTLELYRQLGAPPERLECIYYGVPAERFTPARLASSDDTLASRASRSFLECGGLPPLFPARKRQQAAALQGPLRAQHLGNLTMTPEVSSRAGTAGSADWPSPSARLWPEAGLVASDDTCVSLEAEREARSRGTPCRNTSDVTAIGLVAWFYPPTSGPQTPHATRGIGLKGHETFLDAARIIAGRFPDARFLLAGKGAGARGEEYRQSLIDRCAADDVLRERVQFVGHCDDVASFLAALDVAVQCSLTENLGGTIEALLMERPLVATRTGGMPESVRDEETGLLVPPGDANALAAAILRLLDDRELAARLGRAGRALMLRHFTLEKSGDALAALYTRLAAPGMASRELHEEART